MHVRVHYGCCSSCNPCTHVCVRAVAGWLREVGCLKSSSLVKKGWLLFWHQRFLDFSLTNLHECYYVVIVCLKAQRHNSGIPEQSLLTLLAARQKIVSLSDSHKTRWQNGMTKIVFPAMSYFVDPIKDRSANYDIRADFASNAKYWPIWSILVCILQVSAYLMNTDLY